MLKKIISGGQTGADKAGLDVAISSGIAHGGSIPKGRLTEAGRLPDKYRLTELSSTSYPKRTEKNVIDGDGTAILSHGPLSQGSLLTKKMALNHSKPFIHIDLARIGVTEGADAVVQFVQQNEIEILNIAGPRESGDARIYNAVYAVLELAIKKLA